MLGMGCPGLASVKFGFHVVCVASVEVCHLESYLGSRLGCVRDGLVLQ